MSPLPVVLVAAAADSDSLAAAAALGVACRRGRRRAPVLLDLCEGCGWRQGVLAAEAARDRAAAIAGGAGGEEPRADPTRLLTRGHLVIATCPGAGPDRALALIDRLERSGPLVVHAHATSLDRLLAGRPTGSSGVLVTARRGRDRALCGLLAIELRRRSIPIRIWTHRIGPIQARRARAGLDAGGTTQARAERDVRSLLGGERGQALVAVLGLIVCTLLLALALAALGGAAGSKGRAQRAVDLAALAAARSMRDDFARLLTPALRSDGRPDPAHLSRSEYLDRAGAAARRAAAENGVPAASVRVGFPDRESFAPLRVRVSANPRIELEGVSPDGASAERPRVRVAATAAAEPAASAGAATPTVATGGGYGGPLADRQGKPMRPDVARAFDRMAAAAARAGHALVVNSGYRSDAEQAALFAANPDPRWVARPGTSLHRCATELDLGPPGAHGWLLANSRRFGFVRRYSWEPWHFGFERGPAPCSAAGDRLGGPRRGGDGRGSAGGGLPAYVPAWLRRLLLRAAAAHGVSAPLLAAQLMAESNFNPAAVSAAGAQGIAQFMPATAAAYGLEDPFDPAASVDAQARLMADLLERFGSPRLALAAYNAGPAPVAACGCIPPYPETQAYVARILGLIEGPAALAAPDPLLEVRLIA